MERIQVGSRLYLFKELLYTYTSTKEFQTKIYEKIHSMALYHRHRPQKFKEIVNQKHIVQTITNQVKTEKPAHAYLFSGPRGVGKTSLARILAKALNCLKRKKNDSEPCGSCDSCNEISAGSAIDVIEIDAASHTGVDNVRQNIIENAQFRPTRLA